MASRILSELDQANQLLAKSKRNAAGCLIPPLTPNAKGYVYITRGRGVKLRAHRFIYKTLVKDIPDDILVRHSCDCRACIDPEHLTDGTALDNSADMISRNRQSRLGKPAADDGVLVDAYNMKQRGMTLQQIADAHGLSGPSSAADRVRRGGVLINGA